MTDIFYPDLSGNGRGVLDLDDVARVIIDTSELDFFTPETFGAKGDGTTDDTGAFILLALAVNAAGGGVVNLSATTYAVGGIANQTMQDPAINTYYTWPPTHQYIMGFTNCDRVVINGNGAKIINGPGGKYGVFDTAGNPVVTAPGYLGTGAGTPYYAMIHTEHCHQVSISNLELDGNMANTSVGGYFSDVGIQLPMTGIDCDETEMIHISNVYTHNHGLDGVHIDSYCARKYTVTAVSGTTTFAHGLQGATVNNLSVFVNSVRQLIGFTVNASNVVFDVAVPRYSNVTIRRRDPVDIKSLVIVDNLRASRNGRQNTSLVGVDGIVLRSCSFNQAGKENNGVSSNPRAGLDIESEAQKVTRGIYIENCEFIDNGGNGMVADSGNSAEMVIKSSRFIGTTQYGAWLNKPNIKFKNCLFAGSITQLWHGNGLTGGQIFSPFDAARFEECRFTTDPTESPTGKLHIVNNLMIDGGVKFTTFERCEFEHHVPPIHRNTTITSLVATTGTTPFRTFQYKVSKPQNAVVSAAFSGGATATNVTISDDDMYVSESGLVGTINIGDIVTGVPSASNGNTDGPRFVDCLFRARSGTVAFFGRFRGENHFIERGGVISRSPGGLVTGKSLAGHAEDPFVWTTERTFVTADGTGTGGTGTYTVNPGQTVASTTLQFWDFESLVISGAVPVAEATGSISGTTLTITAVTYGEIKPRQVVTGTGVLGLNSVQYPSSLDAIGRKPIFRGSAAWTPGLIAAGSAVEKDITVTSVVADGGTFSLELGDFISHYSFSVDLNGCFITAAVTGTNQMTVTIHNPTASGITLGAGTVYANGIKRN